MDRAVTPLPGSPPDFADDEALRRGVLGERVGVLYRQSRAEILVGLLVGAVVTFELWSERERELVLFWWGLMLVIAAVRWILTVAYRRADDAAHDKWLRWFAIGAFASGAAWGFAGSVFFPSHADEQQVFLAFLLAGMAAGGIAVFSAVWWVYALFAAGILIPFAYVLATFGNRLFAELALLVPLFYAANVAIAWNLSSVFAAGFRLRHAFGRLTEENAVVNARLQRQLVELDEARHEVETSGRKLALFADRAPIAVVELDEATRIVQVNPSTENLFGFADDELRGRSFKTLLGLDEHGRFDEAWGRILASGAPLSGVLLHHTRRDGLDIDCQWSITPLVNEDGALLALIAQGQDVTCQLEAERLKKEFTSTLSHELRTPLTSIIGSLQLVNSGALGDLDGEILELTAIAERNGTRLLDLINDLLDIEKFESGHLAFSYEVIKLDAVMREAIQLNRAYGERFGVRLVLDGDLPAPDVRIDRKRLLQVITNLISNGAKFSGEGTVVEIGVRLDGGHARIEVRDRGPGIPEEFKSRIFSRFAQADSSTARAKGGTGLGLAICKRFIETMGGRIGFDPRPDGGTIFWIDIPLHRPATARD